MDFSLLPRFELVRTLGEGGCGIVYEVIDRERQSHVALKALTRLDAAALYRFKREFRALGEVSHRNLVQLHELVSANDDWFFTMELVSGVDFLSYVLGTVRPISHTLDSPFDVTETNAARPAVRAGVLASAPESPPDLVRGRDHPAHLPDFVRLRSSLAQLAEGVSALHAAKKLHRDLKPTNVLVTREGRVVILDFGIVAELGTPNEARDASDHDMILGTPVYMAPEQGAGGALTAAGDWYRVGVILFEALTGRAPFIGGPMQVLIDKQKFEPPRPRELVPSCPEDLDDLCASLLRRRPEARPEGTEVLRRLGVQAAAAAPKATTYQTTVPRLIGRADALRILGEAFAATRGGVGETVFVHGGAGMGKTSLVRHFLDAIKANDEAVVLEGRCYERESVPYKGFDSVIDALSGYLRKQPRNDADKLMPTDPSVLARVFPVFERVHAVAAAAKRAEVSDPQQLRLRAFGALRELLARLADRRPLIVFIDDVQWSDLDSAALLNDLTSPPDAPNILFILGYRSEDEATSPALRALRHPRVQVLRPREPRSVAVEALAEGDCRELSRLLLGPDASEALIATVASESGGNPFFLTEIVRFVESHASHVSSTRLRLEKVLGDRVLDLPDHALQVVHLIAVAGRPIVQSVAQRASELDASDWAQAVSIARVGHLVRTSGTGESSRIEPYHDRVRETVVAMLDEDSLRACHLALAHALRETVSPDPEALFVHFRAAGAIEDATTHALRAAEKAARALAFDRAVALYQFAMEMTGKPPRDLRVLLADGLANAGRGAEAADEYLRAIDGANAAEQMDLRRRAAEQLVKSGHIVRGLEAVREVFAHVGVKLASTPRRALIALVFLRLWLRIRGLGFKPRDVSVIPQHALTRIDVCWSVATALGTVDTMRANHMQARATLFALQAGEPWRLCRALATEAVFVSIVGAPTEKRARSILATAEGLGATLGKPEARGYILTCGGMVEYSCGRWSAASEKLDLAASIWQVCAGMRWELATVQTFGFNVLFQLGRLDEMSRRLPALQRGADERGDLFLATSLRVGNVHALIQDQPGRALDVVAEAMSHWSRHGFLVQHWWELESRCMIDLYEGNGAELLDRMRVASRPLRGSLLLRNQVVRGRAAMLRGSGALAAAMRSPNVDLLHVAVREARALRAEKMVWTTAFADVIDAGVAARRGQREVAVAALEGAARGFDAADMALYAACARRRLGALLGGDEGSALVENATAWMRAQGVQSPEKITAMLAAGFDAG